MTRLSPIVWSLFPVAFALISGCSGDDPKKFPAQVTTSSTGAGGGDGGSGGTGGGASTGGGGSGGEGGANLCDNGVLDPGEDCEGSDLGGKSCLDLGFSNPDGMVCNDLCQIDASGCKATCDGQLLEPGEPCDGTALGAETCIDFGYGTPGVLSCSPTCEYDTSGCVAVCDGLIAEPGEMCDGADLFGKDCTNLGFVNAPGLVCSPDCMSFEASGCQSVCGNGVQEPFECEGNPPLGQVCTPTCDFKHTLVINEIFYDRSGTDTGTFIELKGAAGLDLAGYSLKFLDGADGSEYAAELALSGTVGQSGYFLVVQDATVVVPANVGSLMDARADLANGPDNLVLYYAGAVVDAIGYGTFGGADPVFLGETAASVDPTPQASPNSPQVAVARTPDGTDTDDNSLDFAVASPSPGVANP